MGSPRVTVEQHLDRVLGLVAPLPPVRVALPDAVGLACAEEVRAAVAVPRFDHAAMDGYAVRAADVAVAGEDAPVRLRVVGSVAAGAGGREATVGPGEALRIMTGARLPAGADAVTPFEHTADGRATVAEVAVLSPAGSRSNVRLRGEEVAEGRTLAGPGVRLDAALLGLLAAAGVRDVAVRPRPRVAILTTGSELVPAGTPAAAMAGDAVHDSNAVALAAAVRALEGEPGTVGPVPDDVDALRSGLDRAAADADLVVTVGGISAGDKDVVRLALAGADGAWFGAVAVRPGRPQGAATVVTDDGRRVPVVALPGTPTAAFTSFHLFARPALRALAGEPVARLSGRLAAPVRALPDRVQVLPGVRTGGALAAGGADGARGLLAIAGAETLIVVPPGDRLLPTGTTITHVPLRGDRWTQEEDDDE